MKRFIYHQSIKVTIDYTLFRNCKLTLEIPKNSYYLNDKFSSENKDNYYINLNHNFKLSDFLFPLEVKNYIDRYIENNAIRKISTEFLDHIIPTDYNDTSIFWGFKHNMNSFNIFILFPKRNYSIKQEYIQELIIPEDQLLKDKSIQYNYNIKNIDLSNYHIVVFPYSSLSYLIDNKRRYLLKFLYLNKEDERLLKNKICEILNESIIHLSSTY